MAVVKSYTGLDGRLTSINPFPGASSGSLFPNASTQNTYEKGTREYLAFQANFTSQPMFGGQDYSGQLKKLTAEMTSSKEEAEKNTGANRSAVGSLGMSSGIGAAGNAQAGLVGSVNTEVQNDDMLLPYTKV